MRSDVRRFSERLDATPLKLPEPSAGLPSGRRGAEKALPRSDVVLRAGAPRSERVVLRPVAGASGRVAGRVLECGVVRGVSVRAVAFGAGRVSVRRGGGVLSMLQLSGHGGKWCVFLSR